jgi:hypothetical protein
MNGSSATALRRHPRLKLAASLVAGSVVLTAALLGPVLTAGATAANASTTPVARAAARVAASTAAADSRHGSTAYARHLIARLRLPAGSRRMHGKQIADLSPSLAAILTDVVDKRALFHVPERMTALSTYLQAHAPAAMTVTSSGSYSGRNGVIAETVTFSPRHLPAGIFSALLVTTFKPTGHGASVLRADAQVAWFPPRGGAVRIRASDYRAVVVTRSRANGHDRHTKVVTAPREVARLAAMYNRLHGAPDVVTTCPELGPSTIIYLLSFRPAQAGTAAVVLSPTNCQDVGVTIGGKPEPGLYPASTVNAAARRALH